MMNEMKPMPKVSVILPTYNYGRFLGEAVQSVLDQTFDDFELIVVDDGSTDNTREVVNGFTDPRLKYIYKENGGEASAYNVGIQASSGEYIAFLDSDDTWLPRKLELQMKVMESAPRAGLVYSDVFYFDSKTGTIIEQFSQRLHGPLPHGMVLERHIEEFFAHPSTWLVRRMVFDRVGIFDEGQKNSEDEDMLFRIASCFEFEVVPMPLAMARTHLEQKSRNTDAHMIYFMRYLNKTLKSPILNSRMRAILRRELALYHFRYGLFLRRRHEYGRATREFLSSFKANPRWFTSKAKSQLGGKMTQIVGKLTKSLHATRRDEEVKGQPLTTTYPYPDQVVNKNPSAAKVSVIIPAHNYGCYINEAIRSVLDQTFKDFELIMVDDGSTDNTQEVVNSFKDHRVKYIYQENRGVSAARNSGISAASGEYLAFLDADDIWLPQKLELQMRVMESAPLAGLVYSDIFYFDSATGVLTESLFQTLNGPPPRGSVLERHVDEFFAHPSTWLVRRSVFNRVGLFDETQISAEDEDMLFRIASYYEFEVVPLALAEARTHAEQESKKTEVHVTYFLQYLKKIEHSPMLNDHMRRRVRWCLAKYHFLMGIFLRKRKQYGRAAREFLASVKANPRVFASKAISQVIGTLARRFRLLLPKKEARTRPSVIAPHLYRFEDTKKDLSGPKVSVIIRTYNYGRFLGEAIQSALDQTFQDFELVVVDDGSTDDTKQVVSSFTDQRIKYIYQENRGVSAAYNTGISAASGEYLAFLDADDIWLPRKLEFQLKALESHRQAGVVYSDAYFFNSITGDITGTFFQTLQAPPPRGMVLGPYIEEFFAHPSTWMVGKNVFEQVGMFDEEQRTCEDDDMLFRIASSFEFEVVPIPLAKVRTHPEQLSQKSELTYQYLQRYLNKAMQSPAINKRMRATLRRRLSMNHFRYGIQRLRKFRLAKGAIELLAAIKANPFACGYFAMSYLSEKLTRMFYPSSGNEEVEAVPKWLQYLRPDQTVSQMAKKDSSAPKVSVVIATYNYGHYLGEAIQSVLDQTFGDFELIVVDDGSTDNTREVVGNFIDPRIRYIYQKNKGSSYAYNRGILAASGEYIAFLDADDIWFPQKLELKVKILDSNPNIALVCSDTYLFDDETGNIIGRYWHDHAQFKGWFNPRKASQRPLKHMLSRGTFIIETITMVRREVFDEVGGYDVSLKSHEDWDLWCRVTQRFAIETIDLPLAMNRRHSANLSGKQEQMYLSEQMALNKALNSYSLKPDELTLVKRRLARLHFLYGSRSIVDGETALGRKRLLASIRIYPWSTEPYSYLMKSLLGYKLIIAGRSVKKWLKCHLTKVDCQVMPAEELNVNNSMQKEANGNGSNCIKDTGVYAPHPKNRSKLMKKETG